MSDHTPPPAARPPLEIYLGARADSHRIILGGVDITRKVLRSGFKIEMPSTGELPPLVTMQLRADVVVAEGDIERTITPGGQLEELLLGLGWTPPTGDQS